VSAPGQEGRYGLPTGDWFEYVSSPHYLAEILIYVAFVMITGGRVVCLWLILAFVVANLTRSALQTHRWYQGLFPAALPKHRRALFPCLL
jgi:3-oxo-5-alpha-steroid 4-dehydrogenase 3